MNAIRRFAARAALASFAAALAGLAPNGADAERITLRLHNFNSPKAIANRLFMRPWAEEIERKTGGRVRVQVFPAMQLGGKPSDLYGQARDGAVDIAWTVPGYSPGRFPLTEAFELPFVAGDAVATSQALTEFHRKWMKDEYGDTHPLVFHTTARTHIHTSRKPVRTLEDFEGLKIRSPSRIAGEVFAAFGAVSVGMPIPAVYEALSRGVVEGIAVPWTIMRPFRLHEVTDFHTEVGLLNVQFVMAMNKARYEGLPPDIRAVIDDSTGIALAKRLGRLWEDDEAPGRAIAVERGHPILSLPEAERERWARASQAVVDRWVEKVGAMGHDGRMLLAEAKRLVAKYSD